MWTLCTGISLWARTTSTVMKMPTVNTHNMQEKIHLHVIYIEQQQKEKVSRKLIKQSFCWTPSIFMWTRDKVVSGRWDISGVQDISPPCEQALSLMCKVKFNSSAIVYTGYTCTVPSTNKKCLHNCYAPNWVIIFYCCFHLLCYIHKWKHYFVLYIKLTF